MPVVLRVNGYKFFFYEADVANEPPHVHVTKKEMKQNSGSTPFGLGVKADSEKVICAQLSVLLRLTCSFC
jgi:hypothetical protein